MKFSENLTTLKEKAASAAVSAKEKASVIAAIAKANISIYAEEDKMKKAEAELGRLYYNDVIVGGSADQQAYLPVIARITASKDAVARLKQQIAELKAQPGVQKAEQEAAASDEVTEDDFAREPETAEAPQQPETASEHTEKV